MQDNVFGPLGDRQLTALTTIERSAKHLLMLINDILDVAKIEAGQMKLKRSAVAVHLLCESSLAFVEQPALKKGVQIAVHLPSDLPCHRFPPQTHSDAGLGDPDPDSASGIDLWLL